MFGYRSDGKSLKNIEPFFKVMPHIMKRRSDSQVYFTEDIALENLDKYIAKKESEGIKITYMTILYTALVKLLAEKPSLNRFIMNGRVYARKGISISLAIKKEMSESVEETTIKTEFTGNENIFEVKEKLESEIQKNKDLSAENDTDKLAKALAYIPNIIMKLCVNFLIWLDKHGLMPKSVIKASPFHTSAFFTNVGSLGLDAIFHHIYDFGTTGLFLAMGKKKRSFIYDEESFKEEKSISLSIVADERICDGYYFATAIKQLNRYLKKPELLESHSEIKSDVN